MTSRVIDDSAIKVRNRWISEIVTIGSNFGDEASPVETELIREIDERGLDGLIAHLRLCGAINGAFMRAGNGIDALWQLEKQANLEAIAIAKEEGLSFLAQQRGAVLRLSHDEAL